MIDTSVHVVATTISGSISDWHKLDRIVPTFHGHGMSDVILHSADSHREARVLTSKAIRQGATAIISAGGSGTFNSVLEGCYDSGVSLSKLKLGFLRKGSADLIGKTLGMPDDVDRAVEIFVDAIENDHTIPCDVILARSAEGGDGPRHFVGYGGAEIFGRIPHFTENRFIKYYKGIFSQIFGDLGPFTVGMSVATMEKFAKSMGRSGSLWSIQVDGEKVSTERYQALLVLNGYLGPDLPFSSDPLGSGRIHLFGIRDLGCIRLLGQVKSAHDGSILKDPARFGLEHFCASKVLKMTPSQYESFPVNVDGATMNCRRAVEFQIVDSVPLFCAPGLNARARLV